MRAVIDQVMLHLRKVCRGPAAVAPNGARPAAARLLAAGENDAVASATAAGKPRSLRCMAKSMAPPPPTFRFQFMNFRPVTEIAPLAVCHLALSWGSRWAPVSPHHGGQRDGGGVGRIDRESTKLMIRR